MVAYDGRLNPFNQPPGRSMHGTCTTRAISELFALDVRSSRWIAKISARARRLSRPKSCWTDLGMIRTIRMLHGVASCTVRMEPQVAPG